MTLSDAANLASILSVPLSVALWFFTREAAAKFWKKWLGLILCAATALALFASWRVGWFNWLAHPVTWPVWALILLGLAGLLIALLVYIIGQVSVGQTPLLDPSNYRTDEVFGVQWTWGYVGGMLDVHDVSAFCPQHGCMCRLESQMNRNARVNVNLMGFPISLICPRCGFQRDFETDLERLKRNVLVEVERRIRTGEFKNKLSLGRRTN